MINYRRLYKKENAVNEKKHRQNWSFFVIKFDYHFFDHLSDFSVICRISSVRMFIPDHIHSVGILILDDRGRREIVKCIRAARNSVTHTRWTGYRTSTLYSADLYLRLRGGLTPAVTRRVFFFFDKILFWNSSCLFSSSFFLNVLCGYSSTLVGNLASLPRHRTVFLQTNNARRPHPGYMCCYI